MKQGLPQAILTQQLSNCNMLIYGMKGYGKTSFARGLIRKIKRLIILDTLQYEYTEEDGKICSTYEELIKELLASPEEYKIVARMPEDARVFDLLNGISNATFLIEEMDSYCDLYVIPEALSRHYKYGRHRQNNVIALSRNAQEIHPEVRKGSDVIISFFQDEPNVLKYLEKINYEVVEELPKLKKGEYRILKGRKFLQDFLTEQTGEEVEIEERDLLSGLREEKEE